MDNQPPIDPRLLEALEACRPGSDDLAQPEMAELAAALESSEELRALLDRVQKFDAAMA